MYFKHVTSILLQEFMCYSFRKRFLVSLIVAYELSWVLDDKYIIEIVKLSWFTFAMNFDKSTFLIVHVK